MKNGAYKGPRMCNFSVTLGCFMKCKVCYHWQYDESQIQKPTLQEWKQFFSSLKGNVSDDFTVVFGGGEPLMFPEMLLEMVSYCSALGFRTDLATSGHTITREYAAKLAQAGLDNVGLTLFSLDKDKHDAIRGVPGACEKAMAAVESFCQLKGKVNVNINTIIMKPTLDGLLDLVEWVNSHKVLNGIYFQAIMKPFHTSLPADWQKKEDGASLWPDDDGQLKRIINALVEMKKKGYHIFNPVGQFEVFYSYFRDPSRFIKPQRCNLTDGSFFSLDPGGKLWLCPYTQPLGDIRNSDFKSLWDSECSVGLKKKIGECKINCHHLVNCWFEEDNP